MLSRRLRSSAALWAPHKRLRIAAAPGPCLHTLRQAGTRCLITLAIETSCDDTSVAVAELPSSTSLDGKLTVHYHEKITADNDAYNGIHPLVALQSHQSTLATLVQDALRASPHPDLVAVTRGPGMRSNLSVGLNTAKGLALGLGVPFMGVHHMQAHALTPRLVMAMSHDSVPEQTVAPGFPFLTVLASGGHTLLINSTGLTDHSILAETQDIAIGDYLDKSARAILPTDALKAPYGKALESFAFPNGVQDYKYIPPAKRQDDLSTRSTKWRWALRPPLAESKGGQKSTRRMVYSFAGVLTGVQRFMARQIDDDGHLTTEPRLGEEISLEERRDMAKEVLRIAFEHLASRILLHLSSRPLPDIRTIVVSGGVASNLYLRHVLRSILDVRGYRHIDLAFPPVSLCTDNALMIAWAAMEMWHAGYRSALNIEPLRKWSMDPQAEDGGILGASGWTIRSRAE